MYGVLCESRARFGTCNTRHVCLVHNMHHHWCVQHMHFTHLGVVFRPFSRLCLCTPCALACIVWELPSACAPTIGDVSFKTAISCTAVIRAKTEFMCLNACLSCRSGLHSLLHQPSCLKCVSNRLCTSPHHVVQHTHSNYYQTPEKSTRTDTS